MNKKVHAVVGILRRGNTLLVAERPPGKPYSGYWEFPGGKVEADESTALALTRELQEELGVQVVAARPWLSYEYAYPDRMVFLELWLVDEFIGEPQGNEDQQIRWVDLSTFLNLNLLGGINPALDALKQLFV